MLLDAIRAVGETGDVSVFQSADVAAAKDHLKAVDDERCTTSS